MYFLKDSLEMLYVAQCSTFFSDSSLVELFPVHIVIDSSSKAFKMRRN